MSLMIPNLDNLGPRPPLDPAILDGPGPQIRGKTFLSEASPAVSVVAWGATPYAIHPKTRPDYEFSILLEGAFTLVRPDIGEDEISAGEMFVLPPRCTYRWAQSVPTLKFALSYRPASTVEPAPGFTRIRPVSNAPHRELFCSHDGVMKVVSWVLEAGEHLAIPAGTTGLGKVLSGRLTSGSDELVAGNCLLLGSEDRVVLEAAARSELILCLCRSPDGGEGRLVDPLPGA